MGTVTPCARRRARRRRRCAISYSLAVADGDLVVRGDQLGIVFGADKLRQDIVLWLTERYGGDRFHTSMGSILQEFIGDIVSETTRAEIHAEVFRVLQNYQEVMIRRFKESPQLLSPSEMLVSVDDITTTASYDTVTVTMRLRNGANRVTAIKLTTSV